MAPISFYLENHIEEGKEELNFSEWATYSEGRADYKLEECIELLEDGEMPLNSYTWLHSKANLSQEEREMLSAYFQNIRN